MPLPKRIITLLVFSFFIFSLIPGCLEGIFGSTSFKLNAYSIVDDEGFPSISMEFSANDKVTFMMFKSDGSLIDSEYYYSDIKSTLKIGEYKESIQPGNFDLKVFDKKDKLIKKETFFVNGPIIKITDCDQQWWENEGSYYLMDLKLTVENTGDTPGYPHQFILSYNDKTITGLVTPVIADSGSMTIIDCGVFNQTNAIDKSFTISLIDREGNTLASEVLQFQTDTIVSQVSFSKGVDNTLNVPYPDSLHDYYLGLERIHAEDYGVFVFDKYDETYLDLFIELLILSCDFGRFRWNTKSDIDKINYVASFVQNLEYKEDCPGNESVEYPRYPIETLFYETGGGDCEDKAILTASLLNRLDFRTCLIRLPEHMAVGVNLSPEALPDVDFYVEGYYFLETTTIGKPVGFIPNDYRSETNISIYPIDSRPFILHQWRNRVLTIYTNTKEGDLVKVVMYVENLGNDTAQNILVKGGFVTEENTIYNSDSVTIDRLDVGDKKKILLTASIPQSVITWFKTFLYQDGRVVDEEESISTFPS